MTFVSQVWRRTFGAALCALAAAACAGIAGASEPLRSIAQILALPSDELHARRSVVFRGVVTLLSPLMIQDGDDGIRVNQPSDDGGQPGQERIDELSLELGAEVEVSGVARPGRYAPEVAMVSIRVLGTGPLPEPVTLEVSRLFGAGYIGRRVRTTGVVQAVLDNPEGWSLAFESAARRFRVVIDKRSISSRPDALIDAEVEVVGVGYGYRNSRGEFLTPGISVARPEDMRVVVPAAIDGFSLPITPLGGIARYRSKPLGGHRVRTEGVVSFSMPGLLYIQEGIGGVRVDLAPGPGTEQAFQAGDRIEVAGFPDVTTGIGSLSWAVARRIASGRPPAPAEIQPSEIMRHDDAIMHGGEIAPQGSYEGCLIRCRGRLEGVNVSPSETLLNVLEPGSAFVVTLATDGGRITKPLVPGSDVEITGIVRALRRVSTIGDITRGSINISQIDVLVSGPDDIRVVRLPPWWTPGRLAAATATAAVLATAAFLWVTILRREVARQTARAVAEESARFTSALDYEITLRERNRLAANLHDTILQTVTGIAFQLKVCEAHGRRRDDRGSAGVGDPVEVGFDRHLMVARKMVDHAAEQLRGTVWSLRSLPTDGRSFGVALRELCDRLGAGHPARISLDVNARADAAAAPVAGNLLLVVQEAVHNALHHAAPRAIDVRVWTDAAGAIEIEVIDDGSGFELGEQAGPRQGHFGLAGMRERVDGLGGSLTIDTAPRRGTRVRIQVPAAALGKTALAMVHP